MLTSKPNKQSETRQFILEKAFAVIHRKGFRSTGLSDIIKSTGLTKGAFYYHFPSKDALGYAILDELLPVYTSEHWVKPLTNTVDPIDTLQHILRTFMTDQDSVSCGCPLNNLALEMAPVDEEFRKRIDRSYQAWINLIAEALKKGQRAGRVASDVQCEEVAEFFIATFAGCRGYAKVRQSTESLARCNENLCRYLDTLRP